MRKTLALITSLLVSLPGLCQIVCDTTADNVAYLERVLETRYGGRGFSIDEKGANFRPKSGSVVCQEAVDLYIIRQIRQKARTLPQGLSLVGEGKGSSQKESVNAALEDLGLKLGGRVRTVISTSNNNGNYSLSEQTRTDTDFILPEGAACIDTQRRGRKKYTTRITLDISSFLLGREEQILRLRCRLALLLRNTPLPSGPKERKREFHTIDNGLRLAEFSILNNPISDRWGGTLSQTGWERKAQILGGIHPEYEAMFITPENISPRARRAKVFPVTPQEMELCWASSGYSYTVMGAAHSGWKYVRPRN